MQTSTVKVSVITVVYNNVATIAGALESYMAQQGANTELVVIDGGSTDGTLDVLKRYEPHIGVLLSEPDHGIYDALNKGIRLASGDVVGFLHSDDVFADAHVLERIALSFTAPDVDAVYGDLEYVSQHDLHQVVRYWKAGPFRRELLTKGWMPPHPTFYARRELYLRRGGFDTSYKIAADYDCILRLLMPPLIRVQYIPTVLVKMRTGGASNRSLRNILIKSCEDYRALKRNGVGGLKALSYKNLSKLSQFFFRQ